MTTALERYDAEIAELRAYISGHRYKQAKTDAVTALVNKREGYLARAAEEDKVKKALIKALKDLTDIVREREQGNHDLDDLLDAADAALAQNITNGVAP